MSPLPDVEYAEANELNMPKRTVFLMAPVAIVLGLSLYAGCPSIQRAPDLALPAEGDAAPDFVLPSAAHGDVRLSEALTEGPVVLVFYRGHW